MFFNVIEGTMRASLCGDNLRYAIRSILSLAPVSCFGSLTQPSRDDDDDASIPVEPVYKHSLEYNMHHRCRGIALVFNQEV